MADLQGRVALVTGGSRGIGRAISLQLARAGADVAVNYASNADAANAAVEEIRGLGRKAGAYQADVADFEACRSMTERVAADLGRVDILVNNAGIGSAAIGRPSVVDAPLADLHRLMNANLWGALHMVQLVVPQMREADRGNVIMISSVAAQSFGANAVAWRESPGPVPLPQFACALTLIVTKVAPGSSMPSVKEKWSGPKK